jgi:hypothetical protein
MIAQSKENVMRRNLALAACMVLLTCAALARPAEPSKATDVVLADAQKVAKSAKKNVFLMFDASW